MLTTWQKVYLTSKSLKTKTVFYLKEAATRRERTRREQKNRSRSSRRRERVVESCDRVLLSVEREQEDATKHSPLTRVENKNGCHQSLPLSFALKYIH